MDSSLIKESRISRFETCLENSSFPKKRKLFFWKLLPGFQDLEGGFMLEGRGLKNASNRKQPCDFTQAVFGVSKEHECVFPIIKRIVDT